MLRTMARGAIDDAGGFRLLGHAQSKIEHAAYSMRIKSLKN